MLVDAAVRIDYFIFRKVYPGTPPFLNLPLLHAHKGCNIMRAFGLWEPFPCFERLVQVIDQQTFMVCSKLCMRHSIYHCSKLWNKYLSCLYLQSSSERQNHLQLHGVYLMFADDLPCAGVRLSDCHCLHSSHDAHPAVCLQPEERWLDVAACSIVLSHDCSH